VTLADVDRFAHALPGVEDGTTWGRRAWKVGGKAFVHDRPLGKKDRAELGDACPQGEVLGVVVEHLVAKDSLIATQDACFGITHLDGHPRVLVDLDRATPELVEELVEEAWLAAAPPALAEAYVADHGA
jgi:hypothetical protein